MKYIYSNDSTEKLSNLSDIRLLNALKVKVIIARHWKNSGGWVGGKNFLNKFTGRVLTVNGDAYDVIRIICAITLCWNEPYHWLIPVHT